MKTIKTIKRKKHIFLKNIPEIEKNYVIIAKPEFIKPKNKEKILLNYTYFFLDENKGITFNNSNNIKDDLSFLKDYEVIKKYKFNNINILIVIVNNLNILYKDYKWRKYIDFYKYSETPVYCNILNYNMNNHLDNKIILEKENYIRLRKIYTDILTYYEFKKTT